MARRQFSEEDKARARAIYEERGPTAAAEALDTSKGTIGRWAKDGGWRTVRNERTRAATEARMADRELRREELRIKLLERAHVALDRMQVPHVEFVGRAGDRQEIDFPTAGAFRDYAAATKDLVNTFRLEIGEATSREEQVRRDKVEAEAERILSQLNVNGNGKVHAG